MEILESSAVRTHGIFSSLGYLPSHIGIVRWARHDNNKNNNKKQQRSALQAKYFQQTIIT